MERLTLLKHLLEKNKDQSALLKAEQAEIERQILELVSHDETQAGSKRIDTGDGDKLEIKQDFNFSIDVEKLNEIAKEHGTVGYLGTLFNWKPSISKTAFKQTAAEITTPLWAAITSKPAKTSIKIIKSKGNK